jgi:hypothetical protein
MYNNIIKNQNHSIDPLSSLLLRAVVELQRERESDHVHLTMHSPSQYARAVKEIGIEVQELLRQENDERDQRARRLQMLDLSLEDVTTANIVTKILEETNASLLCLTKQSKVAIARENGLIDMIERKKNEIKRNRKLLASLNTGVQPAHNAEYTQLEDELQVEYERYVVKIRNIDYFESELRSYHSLLLQQRERAERMQDAYREETLQILQGERGEEESVKHDDDFVTTNTLSDEDTEPSGSDESLSAPSCNGSDDMSADDSDGSNF